MITRKEIADMEMRQVTLSSDANDLLDEYATLHKEIMGAPLSGADYLTYECIQGDILCYRGMEHGSYGYTEEHVKYLNVDYLFHPKKIREDLEAQKAGEEEETKRRVCRAEDVQKEKDMLQLKELRLKYPDA